MEKLPVVNIFREQQDDQATMGRLEVGALRMFTLELPWRGNAPEVSCIPPGSYKASVRFSNRFQRELPAFHDVPGRVGVLIHSGNTTADTTGCVLVGMALDRERREIVGGTSRRALGLLLDALGDAPEFWVNIKPVEG